MKRFLFFPRGKQGRGGSPAPEILPAVVHGGWGEGGGEEAERLGGEVAQPIRGFSVHGGPARHGGVFSGGGGVLSMTSSGFPATNHPGEHGIGIVRFWGGSGWV